MLRHLSQPAVDESDEGVVRGSSNRSNEKNQNCADWKSEECQLGGEVERIILCHDESLLEQVDEDGCGRGGMTHRGEDNVRFFSNR